MADLVSIGVSGLTAYQNALSVTSNNISNVNTPGYVEEQAVLAPAGLSGNDVISIGGGVLTQSINRLSNEFLESNLRDATAAVGAQNSLVQGLSQLQNEIGSSTSGLSTQLQSFFNSVSSLQANPSDAGTRANFLGAAQSTAEQFNSVGSTLQTLSTDTITQINNAADSVNGVLSQIYSVNQEINLHASDENPPATLLDQRDQLLTQLSQNMGISTQYSDSGAVTVYAGSTATGPALVSSTKLNSLDVVTDPNDISHVSFVLNQKSSPQPIANITTGVIGGYVNFLSQGIAPTVDQINRIANTFGSAINAIQTNGMDATGKVGQPLFYLGPGYNVSGPAIAGSENLNVTMNNPQVVTGNSYTAVYDGNAQQWDITDNVTGAQAQGNGDVKIGGLTFSFSGQAVGGDTFAINPTSTAAQSISMAITDPSQIATASQIQANANIQTNQGNASISATAIPQPSSPTGIKSINQILSNGLNGSGPSTTFSQSLTNKTVAYIPAGTSNINLNASSGNFAIFTRDGVQLTGPSLTSLGVSPSTVLTAANGFNIGAKDSAAARYNTSYLNAPNSQSAYLGQAISYGKTASATPRLDLNGNPIAGQYLPVSLTFGPLSSTPVVLKQGSLSINGRPFPADSDITINSLSDLANQINVSNLGVNATILSSGQGDQIQLTKQVSVTSGALQFDSTKSANTYSLQLKNKSGGFDTITANSDQELVSKINADTANTNVVSSIDSNGNIALNAAASITVNGQTIVGTNLQSLVTNINNQSGATGVKANMNADGSVSLTSGSGLINVTASNFGLLPIKTTDLGQSVTFGPNVTIPEYTVGTNNLGISSNSPQSSSSISNYFVTIDGNRYSAPSLSGLTGNLESTGLYNATVSGQALTITSNGSPTAPVNFIVGGNNLGIAQGTTPDTGPLSIDVSDTISGSQNTDNSAELTQLGISAGFQMSSPLGEDLLVVALPSGTSTLSLQGSFQPAANGANNQSTSVNGVGAFDPNTSAIKRNWQITFTDATHYNISDTDVQPPTQVVTGATFDPTNPIINYGNWSATLTGAPKANDVFTLTPTTSENASSDNSNVQQFSAVANNQTYFGNNMTLQQVYTAAVNDIGAKLSQAQTAQTTQKTVLTQAQSARDSVSGVNLDNELANMIKYQQAYQASSKIVSTAMQLFDYLIQAI